MKKLMTVFGLMLAAVSASSAHAEWNVKILHCSVPYLADAGVSVTVYQSGSMDGIYASVSETSRRGPLYKSDPILVKQQPNTDEYTTIYAGRDFKLSLDMSNPVGAGFQSHLVARIKATQKNGRPLVAKYDQ